MDEFLPVPRIPEEVWAALKEAEEAVEAASGSAYLVRKPGQVEGGQ